MPFTKPIKSDDPIETVRMVARLANLLLELRNEYERRQRPELLQQIKERSNELHELAMQLPGLSEVVTPPPTPAS